MNRRLFAVVFAVLILVCAVSVSADIEVFSMEEAAAHADIILDAEYIGSTREKSDSDVPVEPGSLRYELMFKVVETYKGETSEEIIYLPSQYEANIGDEFFVEGNTYLLFLQSFETSRYDHIIHYSLFLDRTSNRDDGWETCHLELNKILSSDGDSGQITVNQPTESAHAAESNETV